MVKVSTLSTHACFESCSARHCMVSGCCTVAKMTARCALKCTQSALRDAITRPLELYKNLRLQSSASFKFLPHRIITAISMQINQSAIRNFPSERSVVDSWSVVNILTYTDVIYMHTECIAGCDNPAIVAMATKFGLGFSASLSNSFFCDPTGYKPFL